MPRVNIWLPAELHEQVKAAGVPVSEIAQAALKRELESRRRRRLSFPDGRTPDWSNNRRP